MNKKNTTIPARKVRQAAKVNSPVIMTWDLLCTWFGLTRSEARKVLDLYRAKTRTRFVRDHKDVSRARAFAQRVIGMSEGGMARLQALGL